MTGLITWSPPSTNLSPDGIPIKRPPPRWSVAAGVAGGLSFRRRQPWVRFRALGVLGFLAFGP